MTSPSRRTVLLSGVAGLLTSRLPAWAQNAPALDTEWRHFAGDLANQRYSPLDQIDANNFNDLEVAWRFRTEA
jgi:quinoprotein glucose dehydrogenase